MHVFDLTNDFYKDEFGNMIPDNTPIRYKEDGVSLDYCFYEVEETDGEILSSGSYMGHQKSCKSNTRNAGNLFSWLAAIAREQNASNGKNSVCPKGWQLPFNDSLQIKSFDHLIRAAYGIYETDDYSKIITTPLSFGLFGVYSPPSNLHNPVSGVWSNTAASGTLHAYSLYYYYKRMATQNGYYSYFGMSTRCVSR